MTISPQAEVGDSVEVDVECSKGQAERCAHASPRSTCTCACGGVNHGKARLGYKAPTPETHPDLFDEVEE